MLCCRRFQVHARKLGPQAAPPPQKPLFRYNQVLRGIGVAALALVLCPSVIPAPQPGASGSATSQPQAGAESGTDAQQSATPSAAAESTDKNAPEISSQESVANFKVKVNLVEVRVVVRDTYGHAIANLKQDDFQLMDNGKPQIISRFSVEQPGAKLIVSAAAPPRSREGAEPSEGDLPVPTPPQRFIAYLFDDIHLKVADLSQARTAAGRTLEELEPSDRAAIFSTSGQTQIDFTNDVKKLRETLNGLRSTPVGKSLAKDCPDVSDYLADQIQNKHDPMALSLVAQDALDCGAASNSQSAAMVAQSSAFRELQLDNYETQVTLASLRDVVRRLAAMPGQRNIVLVSPGFLNPDQAQEQISIVERALHSAVVINALDARGVYGPAFLDASATRPFSRQTAGQMQQYATLAASADSDVMAELADDTGGVFVRNTNDLQGGLRRLAGPPEVSYLLGFSPQNLRLDGSFHKLKVTLKTQKAAIQARKGYYAPKQLADADAQTKEEIADAVFSQEERNEIPVQLHTQFFKASEEDVKLSVVVRVDLHRLHFRKTAGRNLDDITVVSAVFDGNGNFIAGNQKIIKMRLKDETLTTKLNSGVNLKTSFDVKPGNYMVRLVVRDEEGLMAAQNSAIEIK